MKIQLKTTTGKVTEHEYDDEATVQAVRDSLVNDYDAKTIRVCYNGAVLTDEKRLTDCGVKDGTQLFIAGRKAIPGKTPAPAPTTTPAPAPASAPAATTPQPTEAPQPAPTPESAPTTTAEAPAAPETAPAEPTTTTPTPAPDQPATAAPPASSEQPQPTESAPAPTPAQPAQEQQPATTAPPPQQQPPPAEAEDPDFSIGLSEAILTNLTDMGFDRQKASLALRAAYGNENRAVEYLLDDFPVHRLRMMAQEAMPMGPPAGGGGGGGGSGAPSLAGVGRSNAPGRDTSLSPPASGGGSSGQPGPSTTTTSTATTMTSPSPPPVDTSSPQGQIISVLRNIPNIDSIRTVLQNSPETLPVVMGQLRDTYPDIFSLVEAHPQEFLNVMQSTLPLGGEGSGGSGEDDDEMSEEEALAEALADPETGGGGGGDGEETGDGTRVMSITNHDLPAITELVELGGGSWDFQTVALVFVACRKNKEVAGAVLLENGGLPPQLAELVAQGGVQFGGGPGGMPQ